jgi:hypothetical protein
MDSRRKIVVSCAGGTLLVTILLLVRAFVFASGYESVEDAGPQVWGKYYLILGFAALFGLISIILWIFFFLTRHDNSEFYS